MNDIVNDDVYENFDRFVDELINEKYLRSIIIIATSKIDESLKLILEKYFVQGDEKTQIFDGDKPLSTFFSKIVMAYRLGLISKELFNLLNCIRKIRNICAHNVRVDFNSSPLRDHYRSAKNSVVTHKSYNYVRDRYFSNNKLNSIEEVKCIYLTICCLLEVMNCQVEQIDINYDMVKIF